MTCKRRQLTWPRASVMVAPPCVLRIAASDNPPLMTLHRRITYLQRHLSDQLLPPSLNQVHDRHGLLGRGQGGKNCDTISQRKPPEIHAGRTYVSDKVATPERHEVEEPIGYGVGDDVKLVNGGV